MRGFHGSLPGTQPLYKSVSYDTLKIQGEEEGFWKLLQQSVSLPEDLTKASGNSQVISLPLSFLWELVPKVNAEDF